MSLSIDMIHWQFFNNNNNNNIDTINCQLFTNASKRISLLSGKKMIESFLPKSLSLSKIEMIKIQ